MDIRSLRILKVGMGYGVSFNRFEWEYYLVLTSTAPQHYYQLSLALIKSLLHKVCNPLASLTVLGASFPHATELLRIVLHTYNLSWESLALVYDQRE